MDINLSKQRIAIGSLKMAFSFSDTTTRAIKVKMAVRDTCDMFIINLLLRRQHAIERTWWLTNADVERRWRGMHQPACYARHTASRDSVRSNTLLTGI